MVNQFHIDRENPKDSLMAKKMNVFQERGRRNITIRMRRSSIFSNDMGGFGAAVYVSDNAIAELNPKLS